MKTLYRVAIVQGKKDFTLEIKSVLKKGSLMQYLAEKLNYTYSLTLLEYIASFEMLLDRQLKPTARRRLYFLIYLCDKHTHLKEINDLSLQKEAIRITQKAHKLSARLAFRHDEFLKISKNFGNRHRKQLEAQYDQILDFKLLKTKVKKPSLTRRIGVGYKDHGSIGSPKLPLPLLSEEEWVQLRFKNLLEEIVFKPLR